MYPSLFLFSLSCVFVKYFIRSTIFQFVSDPSIRHVISRRTCGCCSWGCMGYSWFFRGVISVIISNHQYATKAMSPWISCWSKTSGDKLRLIENIIKSLSSSLSARKYFLSSSSSLSLPSAYSLVIDQAVSRAGVRASSQAAFKVSPFLQQQQKTFADAYMHNCTCTITYKRLHVHKWSYTCMHF